MLAQLKDVQSTQTKSQITTIFGDKNTKNTPLDVTILKSMGFKPSPLISKAGITATYSLDQPWTTSSTKLRIKITLKRTGKDSKSKIIIITPKVISFNAEEDKFASQISDKTKAQISAVLTNKRIDFLLTPEILKQIGFKEPSDLEPTFKPTYTLEEVWIDSSTEVQIKVILEKSGEESSGKIFAVLPKGEVQVINIFKDELKKWESFKTQNSQKTIAQVNSILSGKKKGAALDSSVLTNIGFKTPSDHDVAFSPTYTLEEDWSDDSTKVQVKVVLKKDGKKSLGMILTMNTKNINFQPELDKFSPSYTSTTKTKKEIIDKLDKKSLKVDSKLVDLADVGYSQPALVGVNPTYKLIEVPTHDSSQVKIEVTLEKRGDKATKEITITPMTIDFRGELGKFSSSYTSTTKTRKEITEQLNTKSITVSGTSDITDLTDVGYSQPPVFDSSFTATYKLTKVPSNIDHTVTIKVTLQKRGDKATKEITITPMTIDFRGELGKFSSSYTSTTKTRKEITEQLNTKSITVSGTSDITDLTDVGYSQPPVFDSSFTATYKLTKVPSNIDHTVTIKVTLQKRGDKATKEITITPMTIDFRGELGKFSSSYTSTTKTRKEITEQLNTKSITVSGTSDITDLTDAGYSQPPVFDSSFTATYKLTKVPSNIDHTVTIKVTLTKKLMTATKEITITPMTIDFSAELAKFVDKTSSKTKTEIINALKSSSNTATAIGLTNVENLDSKFTATYKRIEVPTHDSSQVKIEVTLQKRGDKATKEITITPMTIDFSAELGKFNDEYTTKTKEEFNSALYEIEKNHKLTQTHLQDIGYNPPALTRTFAATYILDEAVIPTSTEVKIKVIIKNRGDESSGKVIKIKSTSPIFDKELEKIPSYKRIVQIAGSDGTTKIEKKEKMQKYLISTKIRSRVSSKLVSTFESFKNLNDSEFIKLTNEQLGIKEPKFSKEIYATYKLKGEHNDFYFTSYSLSIQLVKEIEGENGNKEKIKSQIINVELYTKYLYMKFWFRITKYKSSKTDEQLSTFYSNQFKSGKTTIILGDKGKKDFLSLFPKPLEVPLDEDKEKFEIIIFKKSTRSKPGETSKLKYAFMINIKTKKDDEIFSSNILEIKAKPSK